MFKTCLQKRCADFLCTGFDLLLVFVRFHLLVYDDDGSDGFEKTRLAQRNFLPQSGSQLGRIWSVNCHTFFISYTVLCFCVFFYF